jgi:hypothetical protein
MAATAQIHITANVFEARIAARGYWLGLLAKVALDARHQGGAVFGSQTFSLVAQIR